MSSTTRHLLKTLLSLGIFYLFERLVTKNSLRPPLKAPPAVGLDVKTAKGSYNLDRDQTDDRAEPSLSDLDAATRIADALAGKGMVSQAPPPGESTIGKDLLVGTVSQVLGSLVTVIIVYLVLVAGSVINGSKPVIIIIAVILGMLLVLALLGMFLWMFGSLSNNYTRSVRGRRAALLIVVPLVSGLLALLYLAIKTTESGLS